MLIDNDFELQCAKYTEDGTCEFKHLNPFYTKTEYYDPIAMIARKIGIKR